MLSPNTKLQIANYCYALVSGMFADFHNPKHLKLGRQWGSFPALSGRMAKSQIFLTGLVTDSNRHKAEALAEKYALEIATTLIDRAGYA